MPEELGVTFRTWRQADLTTLEQFYYLIRKNPVLHPEKLGPYEPLEYDFEEISAEHLARITIEERSLITQRSRPPEQIIFSTHLSEAKKPNVFSHTMEGVGEGSEQARTFCDYAFELFKLFEPVYGRVCCEADYSDKNQVPGSITPDTVGIDLRRYLPGLYWANFFGPQYIKFFGEEKLLNAPAHRVEWLADAGIVLFVSENPFEYGTEEVTQKEQEIVDHLGSEAFFSKSDPDSKEYSAPDV